jgi:hypothetical protein
MCWLRRCMPTSMPTSILSKCHRRFRRLFD